MNIIKKILGSFNINSTEKKQQADSVNKQETYFDIIISLNKNYEIDFSIFLEDKVQNLPISELDYSILCGSFINSVMSNKMKIDAIDILDNQIKNTNNQKLINNIVSLISPGADNPKRSDTFIKPSEVFSKNSI